MKHLTARPVIKNVDIEELKKQFSTTPAKEVVAPEEKAGVNAPAPVAKVAAPVAPETAATEEAKVSAE